MPHLRYIPLLALAGSLTACSSAEPVETTEDTLSFTTGEFEAPPGDSFECFYTDTFTDREINVWGANGQQGLGGHHILVYYTDVPRDPQHHPCDDAEMVSWHQISGSGGQDNPAEGAIALPEGFALKVPAGKQLVLQAHYINTTGAPQKVNDQVKLFLMDAADVESYVNYYTVVDQGFEVAPLSKLERSSVCTVERDFDMLLSLGHMHEYGTHYKMEIIDDKGGMKEMIRDEAWREEFVSHAPVTYYPKDKPLHLAKGTRLRQTCTWNNTTADPLLFPREMCVGFFYYFPDAGELNCEEMTVE